MFRRYHRRSRPADPAAKNPRRHGQTDRQVSKSFSQPWERALDPVGIDTVAGDWPDLYGAPEQCQEFLQLLTTLSKNLSADLGD